MNFKSVGMYDILLEILWFGVPDSDVDLSIASVSSVGCSNNIQNLKKKRNKKCIKQITSISQVLKRNSIKMILLPNAINNLFVRI